jgi:antitoxin CptB
MATSPSEELSRLRWHCRRGMRELDVLLQRYLDEDYPRASRPERAAFERILELQDPEIFGYLVGRDSPTEDALRDVVARIRRVDD